MLNQNDSSLPRDVCAYEAIQVKLNRTLPRLDVKALRCWIDSVDGPRALECAVDATQDAAVELRSRPPLDAKPAPFPKNILQRFDLRQYGSRLCLYS